MGKKAHLYNDTDMTAKCSLWGQQGTLEPRRYLENGWCNSGKNGSHTTSVVLIDKKGREVKGLSFTNEQGWKDKSWIILPDGVRQQNYGKPLHEVKYDGKWHRWQWDKEASYQAQDRKEEEEKRKAEMAREEARRKEQEQKEKDAAERKARAEAISTALEMKVADNWRSEFHAAKEKEELLQFSQTSAQYVPGEVELHSISETGNTYSSPLEFLLIEHFANNPAGSTLTELTKKDIFGKIKTGQNFITPYSTTEIHLQALEIFATVFTEIELNSSELLAALLNEFSIACEKYIAKPMDECNMDVCNRMWNVRSRLETSFRQRIQQLPFSEIEKMILSSGPPKKFCHGIISTIMAQHGFPENPKTWSLFSFFFRYSTPFQFFERALYVQKYEDIEEMWRHPFLELLYSMCVQDFEGGTFLEKEGVTNKFLEISTYLLSVPEVRKDFTGEKWVFRFIIKYFENHAKYRIPISEFIEEKPFPFEFLYFIHETGRIPTATMVSYICDVLSALSSKCILTEETKPKILKNAEVMARILLAFVEKKEETHKLKWNPDFLIKCFTEEGILNLKTKAIILKAFKLMRVGKIRPNVVESIYIWLKKHGLDDPRKTVQVLEICMVLYSPENYCHLNGEVFTKTVGEFVEKVLIYYVILWKKDGNKELLITAMDAYTLTIKHGFPVKVEVLGTIARVSRQFASLEKLGEMLLLAFEETTCIWDDVDIFSTFYIDFNFQIQAGHYSNNLFSLLMKILDKGFIKASRFEDIFSCYIRKPPSLIIDEKNYGERLQLLGEIMAKTRITFDHNLPTFLESEILYGIEKFPTVILQALQDGNPIIHSLHVNFLDNIVPSCFKIVLRLRDQRKVASLLEVLSTLLTLSDVHLTEVTVGNLLSISETANDRTLHPNAWKLALQTYKTASDIAIFTQGGRPTGLAQTLKNNIMNLAGKCDWSDIEEIVVEFTSYFYQRFVHREDKDLETIQEITAAFGSLSKQSFFQLEKTLIAIYWKDKEKEPAILNALLQLLKKVDNSYFPQLDSTTILIFLKHAAANQEVFLHLPRIVSSLPFYKYLLDTDEKSLLQAAEKLLSSDEEEKNNVGFEIFFKIQLFKMPRDNLPTLCKADTDESIFNNLLKRWKSFKTLDPFSLQKIWIFDWIKYDLQDVETFLKAVKNLRYWRTNVVIILCALVEFYFEVGKFLEMEKCYLRAQKYLPCESTGENSFVDSLLAIPYKKRSHRFNFLLLHRSFIATKLGNFREARALLDIGAEVTLNSGNNDSEKADSVDSEFGFYEHSFPELTGVAETAAKLRSLTSLALVNGKKEWVNVLTSFPELKKYVIKFFDILKLDSKQENCKHYQTLCQKIGTRIFTDEGVNILRSVTKFGDCYDYNILKSFEPEDWVPQLFRSAVLTKIKDACEDDWTDEAEKNVVSILDSFFLPQTKGGSAFVGLYKDWKRLSARWTEGPIKTWFKNLFLLHLQNDTGKSKSLKELQTNWLQQNFRGVTQELSNTLWDLVSASGFFDSANHVILLERFLASAKENAIEDVIQFLLAEKDAPNFINSIKSFVMFNYKNKAPNSLKAFQNEVGFQRAMQKIPEVLSLFLTEEQKTHHGEEEFEEDKVPFQLSNCYMILSLLHSEENDWSFKEIGTLLSIISGQERYVSKGVDAVSALCQTLSSIYSYGMTAEKTLESLTEKKLLEWPQLIAQNHSLQTSIGMIKDDDLLLREIEGGNLTGLTQIREILSELQDIAMSAEEIKKWSTKVKTQDFIPSEAISILRQAINHEFGYLPRTTQIISLLLLLFKDEKKGGRLLKVSTGEGKSVTVAMFAAYKFLQTGKNVEIVTSSCILAERDAAEFKGFYSMLGISVDSLRDNNQQTDKKDSRSCYSANIIYGDSSSFQADILRHEFSLLNTRGKRGFEIVVVDEVDCMLIDQGGHSTRLVDKMPGLEHLEAVFVAIWVHLDATLSSIIYLRDGGFYAMKEIPGTGESTGWIESLSLHFKKNVDMKGIKEFAEQAKKGEQTDVKAREAIALLLNNEEILLPHDLMETVKGILSLEEEIEVGKHDALINDVIETRWSTASDANCLQFLNQILGMEETKEEVCITIYHINYDESCIEPSPRFHGDLLPTTNEKTVKFLLVDKFLLFLESISDKGKFLGETLVAKIKPSFELSSKSCNLNDFTKLKLPKHFGTLYNHKLVKWIESAITVKERMEQNRDYLVKKDDDGILRIVPIDFESTGVLQEGTVWSDGIHQFLQLKHQLALTPENLATNFISNLSFFRRFSGEIHGLTGTLGSEVEKGLLERVYNVDTVDIPTFKPRQLTQLAHLAAPSTQHWLSLIATSVLLHTKMRAVLLICRSIQDVNQIEAYLRPHEEKFGTLNKYTRSDLESESSTTDKKVKVGAVIIATNLAGRGTDFKLDEEVVKNGGLHVCITFLPTNLRVGEQAAGRAGRQGQPGTYQMIINSEDSENLLGDPLNELIARRDRLEVERVNKIDQEIIPPLVEREEAFQLYCKLRIRAKQGKEHGKIFISALDEQWGVLLDTCENVSNIKEQLEIGCLVPGSINNPYYYILLGNEYIFSMDYENAISAYQNAIYLDGAFTHNAYYYKAFSLLNKRDNKKTYKSEADECLNKCAAIICNVAIPSLVAIHSLGSKRDASGEAREFKELNPNSNAVVKPLEEDSEFTKAIANKISIFQVQLKTIEEAMKKMVEYSEVRANLVGLEQCCRDAGVAEPRVELSEQRHLGLIGFLKVTKRPPPWYAVFVVILLGVAEVVTGSVLAFFTAGAWGTSLITDGVLDVYKGVKAAINKDYIDLGDFFKEKGITMAISLAMSVAGAAVSAAVEAAKAVVIKAAKMFIQTGVGKFLMSAGNKLISFGQKIGLIGKAGGPSKFSRLFSNFKNFVSKKISTLSKAMKLDKASNYLKKKISQVWKGMNNFYKRVAKFSPFKLSKTAKTNLLHVGKLIGYEFAKTGLTDVMHLAANKVALEPLFKAIEEKLKKKIKADLLNAFHQEKTNAVLNSFFSSARSKESFDALWRDLLSRGSHFASNSISVGQSDAEKYTYQALSAFSNEIQRIMGNHDSRFQRNVAAWIINTITLATESAKFITVVDKLTKYLPTVIRKLEQDLEQQLIQRDTRTEKASGRKSIWGMVFKLHYLSSEKGQLDLEEVINSLAEIMAEKMANNMTTLIQSGIINPSVSFGVAGLVDKLLPNPKEKIFNDWKQSNEKKGRANWNNPSFWGLVTNALPSRKTGMPSKNQIAETWNAPPAFRDLQFLSSELRRPVHIYTLQEGEIRLDRTLGRNEGNPVILLQQDFSFLPMTTDSASQQRIIPGSNFSGDAISSVISALVTEGSLSQKHMVDLAFKFRVNSAKSLPFYGTEDMRIINNRTI